MKVGRFILTGLVLMTLAVPRVQADVPGLLHYQGYLTDVEGTPVSGVWTVTFSFFEDQVGGQDFFSEAQVVEPDVGVFSVVLGSQPGNGIDPAWFSGGEAWLELTVDDGVAAPVVLQPRQRVTSHPYAMWTDSAGTCGEATNALGLGGEPAESYATTDALTALITAEDLPTLLEELGYVPGVEGYGDEDVQAYLELMGIEAGAGYADEDVAAYLLLNGYAPGPYFDGDYLSLANLPDLSVYLTAEDLADLVVGDELLDQVAASGLFLMADGSVVASGDLDIGGYQLLDVVIENASAADAPEGAAGGQLWFDTDESALKVYDGEDWVTLGAAADLSNFDCDGCVDPEDVSFGYAGATGPGGAAFTSMGLICEGCVEAEALNVSWALGTSAGGAAAGLDCVGCVTLGHLSADATHAGNQAYDDTDTQLGVATVQDAIVALDAKVEATGPGSVKEGNGTIVAYEGQWGLPAYGTVTQYIHLLNPAAPKILAYLYGGEDTSFASSNNLVVAYDFAPNQYSSNVQGTAGQAVIQVQNPSVFTQGAHILLYQTVGTGGNGAGAGAWELNSVLSVEGNTVQLAKPLEQDFVDAGTTNGQAQAVVAASYNNLEIVSGGNVHPSKGLDDNADSGGIVYIRAQNITIKSGGKIQADGYGFAYIGSGYTGDSHCKANNLDQRQPNCSGGGSGCCDSDCGGGGGGNKTGGTDASTYSCSSSYRGLGGQPWGSEGTDTLTMGGAGGSSESYGSNSSDYGHGGGLVIVGAKNLIIEPGGMITSHGRNGQSSYNGGGAGGTVAIFADNYVNEGTVEANGGIGHKNGNYQQGGDGGEGWIHIDSVVPGVVSESFPKAVVIKVDGVDVTAQVGDPNGKGSPHWNGVENVWGADGLTAWSSGPLDLSAVANWTLGEHSIELHETGGAGGDLKLYTYVVYPFTNSALPTNDTCAAPEVLDVMSGAVVTSGTTEDIMGKIKATDAYVQPFCGGSGGPEVVYQFTLTDWRKLTVDVTAPFDPRVYIRKTICSTGDAVACGTTSFETADLKTGTYYLFVDSDGNLQKGNFTLSIQAEAPSPPSNDTCADPFELQFVNGAASQYGVSLFSNDSYSAGCGGAGGADNVFSFEVPPGTQQVAITVDADFDPVIYLAKAVCEGGYIACAPAAEYTIGWPEPGTYFLVVDGASADDKGEYTVGVTMQ